MSHDAGMIPLEVYDFSLASTGGPSTRTIVPYSPPVLTSPGIVPPSTPKNKDYERKSVQSYLKDGWTKQPGTPLLGRHHTFLGGVSWLELSSGFFRISEWRVLNWKTISMIN